MSSGGSRQAAAASDLGQALGRALETEVSSLAPVAGGSICQAFKVDLVDGRRVFVKTHHEGQAMFAAEAEGLAWLAAAGALPCPEVLAVSGDDAPLPYLALSWIEPGKPGPEFGRLLGQGLARVHAARPPGLGHARNNFIGPLPQDNTAAASWPEFWGERRLRPLIRLGVDAGQIDGGLHRCLEECLDRLPEVLPDVSPCRLHGDLWSGNVLCGADGQPWLIDPAVYGGHGEVDLAMMRLFGGFGSDIFAEYNKLTPLDPGAGSRIPYYQLYPLLVHLLLFGATYAEPVRRAALGRSG